MASKNTEAVQPQQHQLFSHEQDQEHFGDTPSHFENVDSRSRDSNTVFKRGLLSISSKGIGWTLWKKRWFILTRTSLVFFRSDPSAVQQKDSEVNLTLGGIDLNNSASVVVKADKKLLTVLFPDGRDGRAFTLKADTMDDLYEWKSALENALIQAPSASHVMGQNSIFRNDHGDVVIGVDEKEDELPTKSTILRRSVLHALEDIDGAPSFLEKALRFVEHHGVKIEGILRQAADVDDVENRIREYDQGKNEFTPEEDAHIIADCLKYFLRELSSSPVPASCCNSLLEACRTDRESRVNAMRAIICESFPEPNRRLLQRILMMMQTVASNKNVNRMNTNAVAACMAPLLLRPLLAGDCEIENDFDVGGDGSMQLLQAAAAANHAQAIVITLLEEYNDIFGERSLSPDLYFDSEESGSGTEEGTDGEDYDDDDTHGSYDYIDEEEDFENEYNGSHSKIVISADNHESNKINENLIPESKNLNGSREPNKVLLGSRRSSLPRQDDAKKDDIIVKGVENTKIKVSRNEDTNSSTSDVASGIQKPLTLSSALRGSKRLWGRTAGKKNLSMESIDFKVDVDEDDADMEGLESAKLELQKKILEEVKKNRVLQASLERRKDTLYGRRQALEKDVGRLQEKLQQERDSKLALREGLDMLKGNQPCLKAKKDMQDVAQAEADIANLEYKVDDLENRLRQKVVRTFEATYVNNKESREIPKHNTKMKEKQNDTEDSATHVFERLTLKDEDVRENEHDPQRKNLQQIMPRGSSKLVGMSKTFITKEEGTTTTIYALSKLTMRLNVLKERQSQIADELLNMDKGRRLGPSSPSFGENHLLENLQESEKGISSNKNSDKRRVYSPHVLDIGRFEHGGDRGRRPGGSHPNTTLRTFSG